LANADWLNTKKIENLFDKAKKNDRFGQIIWMFTNIQLWKNKYFNKDWRY
jgi:asparagine synthase (glutamine-hydrolysing)